jgi:hypothetical protein
MKKSIKNISSLMVLLIGLLLTSSAHADLITIDLNASPGAGGPNDINNGVTLSLGGSSTFTAIIDRIGVADGGAYNAWNAWSVVAGCDASGANCVYGWVNSWSYFLNGDKSTATWVGDSKRFSTDVGALASATTIQPIVDVSSITFFIADAPYWDNVGGISLLVDFHSVLEPSTLALLGIGLVGIGLVRRRQA